MVGRTLENSFSVYPIGEEKIDGRKFTVSCDEYIALISGKGDVEGKDDVEYHNDICVLKLRSASKKLPSNLTPIKIGCVNKNQFLSYKVISVSSREDFEMSQFSKYLLSGNMKEVLDKEQRCGEIDKKLCYSFGNEEDKIVGGDSGEML